MDEAKRSLVRAWLAKADEDLAVARLLIEQERRLLSSGVYHCQQAAEKALKAWLTSRDIVFPKTHDLESLLHLGRAAEPGLAAYLEPAQALTPLATEYRYPGDAVTPSFEEAHQALTDALMIVRFVHGKLAV